MAVGFMGKAFTARPRNMDSLHRMRSLVPTPVPSVVLITEARVEASPPAGSRASAEAFMAVEVSMAAEVMVVAVTGNSGFSTHKDI